MPTDTDPDGTGRDRQRAVYLQQFNGRSTDRCQAAYGRAIVTPCEVIVPGLAPRIEQGNDLACFRIERLRSIELVSVTGATGQTQVVFCCHATQGAGKDVIDLGGLPRQPFRGLAVLAAMLGPRAD